jgi:hypothetical protein
MFRQSHSNLSQNTDNTLNFAVGRVHLGNYNMASVCEMDSYFKHVHFHSWKDNYVLGRLGTRFQGRLENRTACRQNDTMRVHLAIISYQCGVAKIIIVTELKECFTEINNGWIIL